MADEPLKGLTGAILATEGFGQFELTEPRKALDEARARTEVVSPKADRVRGWKFTDWGDEIRVDSQARRYPAFNPERSSCSMPPVGGVMPPDAVESAAQRVERRSFGSTGTQHCDHRPAPKAGSPAQANGWLLRRAAEDSPRRTRRATKNWGFVSFVTFVVR